MDEPPSTAGRPAFRHLPQILGIIILMPLVLWLDSPGLAQTIPHGQWISNGLTVVYFAWIFMTATSRLRGLLIAGLVVATAGEVVFALLVGMYEYRLKNIPLYVPPGHTLVYVAVYYFTRESWTRSRSTAVRNVSLLLAALFSTYWLMVSNDVYGFLCFLIFCAIVALNKDSQLFFPVMFLMVLYLEVIGTRFGNWFWHPILLNRFDLIPSGNPPAGISVFYFGFDAGCLSLYLMTKPLLRVRFDAQRAVRMASGGSGSCP